MATLVPTIEAADWTVPHTKFEIAPDGFKVSFSNTPEALHRFNGSLAGTMKGATGIAAMFQGLIVLALLMIGLVIRLICFAFPTVITVDREHVTIGNKRLLRQDFGSFSVAHTIQDEKRTHGVLGYSYGHRSFSFGGLWDEKQATEVASALNKYLRKTPATADVGQASPIALRAARPTDF